MALKNLAKLQIITLYYVPMRYPVVLYCGKCG